MACKTQDCLLAGTRYDAGIGIQETGGNGDDDKAESSNINNISVIVAEMCKILLRGTEMALISFIEHNCEDPNFPFLLKQLTATARLTGVVKEYIVAKFHDRQEFFHTLLTYIDMAEVSELLGRFYEPGRSLDALLRCMHPQDLLIELHCFRDVETHTRSCARA